MLQALVWPRGWVEVYLYSSMTAALEGSEWSAARPGRTLPPGKIRYPLYRRLGGPQGRSGRAENLAPTGIRSGSSNPQSVAIPTELPGPLLIQLLRLINYVKIKPIRILVWLHICHIVVFPLQQKPEASRSPLWSALLQNVPIGAPKIPGGMELNGKRSVLFFADDVNLLGKNGNIK